LYVHTTGAKVASADALPTFLQQQIDTHFPAFRSPPPLDDNAPMDTSWTEYRVIRETGKQWFA
jgi:Protein of unknown function (DUF1838)